MEPETSLPTTVRAIENNTYWARFEPEQNTSQYFNFVPPGVSDQYPAVATSECASSPTQHRGKRRRAKEYAGSMETALPYQKRTRMTELKDDSGGENSSQPYICKVPAQKGHLPGSIDGGYETISNSTRSGLLTHPSNIDGGEKEPGHPSITIQSAVPSGHSANSMSANTPGQQSYNQNSGSGVPLGGFYGTPQKLMTQRGSRNSSSNWSGSRTPSSSPHFVTPPKRSGKTPNSEESPKALRMICWHSASGVACSGGRSDEARRLLKYVPPP
jgi:hypothetical protein